MAGRKIGEAYVSVDADTKNLGDKTAKDVKSKLGGALKGAGLAVGAMLGGAILQALGAAVRSASDLNETVSATTQIFGKSGDAIVAWSKTADKALGQSQQTALDAANTFATYGKQAGLSGQALVDFATKNAALATDMASFRNTSPEAAIEAIGAAFRGESDPIEKYGVLLNEAVIQNEAVRIGLIKTTKDALTPQQRVLAAQSAILKQTGDAQGDFARTSTGLANAQRIAKAEFENNKVLLGQSLLPILMQITAVLGTIVPPVIAWVQANKLLVAILGSLVIVLWAVNVAMYANPIVLVAVGLVALVAAVVLAYNKFSWFRTGVDAVWSFLKMVGAWFAGPFVQFFVSAANWVVNAWHAVVNFFSALPGQIWAFISSIPQRLQALWMQAFDLATYAIGYGIGLVIKFLLTLPQRSWEALSSLPGRVLSIIQSVQSFLVNGAKAAVDRTIDFFTQVLPRVLGALAALPGKLYGFFRDMGVALYGIGQDIISGLINGIKSMISAAIDAVKRGVSNIIQGAKDALGVHSPSTVFAEMGRQSVAGYVKGFTQAARAAAGQIGGQIGGPAMALAGAGTAPGGQTFDQSRTTTINVYGGQSSPEEISARVQQDLAWNDGV